MRIGRYKSARLFLQNRTLQNIYRPSPQLLALALTLLNAVDPVTEPGGDVYECGPQDPGHHLPGPGDGAEVAGPGGLADVDVALDRQDQSQPDRGVVEQLGGRLHEQLVQETQGLRPLHGVMASKE